MDFNSPFLTEQIIAYIGNKRKLLNLIYNALEQTLPEIKPGLKFFDAFSGSGVVSRLAKHLNFEVYSNDWENYSYIINNGYIKTDRKDIITLFGSEKKLIGYLNEINNLPAPEYGEQYISKFYAPESFNIDEADFRVERLFYTRENAFQIDKIRNYIDKYHPMSSDNRLRYFLLGLLLYQCATHTNTSGVFKAFHKGFGGHNRDALKRILSPIRLEYPQLIDSDYPVHIFREDTGKLVESDRIRNIDIAYLDPPYNQHQYGSNYHLLNTIALWDKINAPLVLNERGVLKEKAAIRKDWTATKSDYCYTEPAITSFASLIKNLDAEYILISYSTDGLIPFEVMKDICAEKGKISIVTNEYIKYRGGKQSNSRLNTNIEFVLIIDSGKKNISRSILDIETIVNRKKILLLFKQKYSRKRLEKLCEEVKENKITIKAGAKKIIIDSRNYFELLPPDGLNKLSVKESGALYRILSSCVCDTKEEELDEIVSKINGNGADNRYFIKLIPGTLRKLAHKKNKEQFYHWLGIIQNLESSHPEIYSTVKDKIVGIAELAELRFNN